MIGIVSMPNDATKIVNEKVASGTQLKFSTGYPPDFNDMYTPITVKPTAVPIFEIANKNCGKIPSQLKC